jgi:adenine-specific DNA-methyltransferase
MHRLDLQTPDFTSANIARLAELFPNCVTESKRPDGTLKRAIDFDLLSQELSHDLVEGPQERYRLDWPGKREALALANEPIRKTLRPSREESVNFDLTKNLYIEGDNLDALKLLQETYLGQVKMIYIDPPYNTGNDFIYDDDFSMSRDAYESSSGEVDEDGNAMFDEDKWKQNASSNGRFHSEWLSMIYPRLKLARNLLKDDGLIFISIDDGEVANLKKVCDEILGSDCFIGQLVWKSRVSEDTRAKSGLSTDHEYSICYGKTPIATLRGVEKDLQKFSNPDNDQRGPWRSADVTGLATIDKRPNLHYPLINPDTGIAFQAPPKGWRFGRETMDQKITEKRILWPASQDGRPRQKLFLNEMTSIFKNLSSIISVTSTSDGTREINAIFGNGHFDFPKPVQLLKTLVLQSTEDHSLVLDFFSGSATTAHAVMQLNAEDGGTRRHIMVQLPEPCSEKSEAYKAGYKTIAEIGKERIRRAGAKIRKELEEKLAKELPGSEEHESLKTRLTSLDTGFRVLKVDSSNMADVYYQPDELTQDSLSLHVDNLKAGRSEEDLLFQVLLDWGVDLTLPVTEEKIEGKRVFFVDARSEIPGAMPEIAACFDTGLDESFVKALAKRIPLRAVFRDASYASDSAKINIEQIFKALSPHTELKTL